MERISRMLRSGLAMVLALCMILSACPIVAFAQETEADNVKYVLGEMKGFLEEYAPNVASQAYDLWIKNGYQEKVDECIAELIALLDARKANYTDVVLPALNDTIAALSAQKDALSAELTVLKAQLEALAEPAAKGPHAE